jgi:hypothetical protein
MSAVVVANVDMLGSSLYNAFSDVCQGSLRIAIDRERFKIFAEVFVQLK